MNTKHEELEMLDNFFESLETVDIKNVIKCIEMELFDYERRTTAGRRSFLDRKLKRYKDELIHRVILGEEV